MWLFFLLHLVYPIPGSCVKQNDFAFISMMRAHPSVDLDHFGRASMQLERAYRPQSGYIERDLLTGNTSQSYVDMSFWNTQTDGTSGLTAVQNHNAVQTFNNLLANISSSAFSVSRVFTNNAATPGSHTQYYQFTLSSRVTDDNLMQQVTWLDTLYKQQSGYLQLVLMKSIQGRTWVMLSKWSSLSDFNYAMTMNATTFWSLVNSSTVARWPLTLQYLFQFTLGTPMSYVMLDTFFLQEGEDGDAFLQAMADCESTMRQEVGYLGRNLMWASDGRISVEWWWDTKPNMDSSLLRITDFEFMNTINTTTQTRNFYQTKASFQPWMWDKTILCGSPVYLRQYSLAPNVTQEQYFNRIQVAEDQFREEGLIEWNILQDMSNASLLLDVGWQWENYSSFYNGMTRLAQKPASLAALKAVDDSTTKRATYYHIAGFWPWTTTVYACTRRIEVDPTLTGVGWPDYTLHRPQPMHQVVYPAPGIRPIGKLLVLLPNFGRIPLNYLHFMDEASDLGYLVVGLVYLNGIEIPRLCVGDSECLKGSWDALLFGATEDSPSPVLDVDPVDGIENRLLSLLKYVADTQPWMGADQFYDDQGLLYERMAWVGAGWGASAVFALAEVKLLDLAVAFDGPVDPWQTGAEWLSGSAMTPKNRWFSVASQLSPRAEDTQKNALKANVSLSNMACFTHAAAGAVDSTSMQSWQTLYTMTEVWHYTLSQCGSSGLTDIQIQNITDGAPHFCDGTGEVQLFIDNPEVFVGGLCPKPNQNPVPMLYVSPVGYDRGTCPQSNPCRTIQYAVNQAPPGGQINIARGVYEENVVIPMEKRGITLIGAVDKDKVPEAILQCGAPGFTGDNYCLIIHAPEVTITLMQFAHIEELPEVREVGIVFTDNATNTVVQKSIFTRAGVLDTNPGSAAIEVLGALNTGILDNSFKGSYQRGIVVRGSRTAVLRNTIWGTNLTEVGIILLNGNGTVEAVNSTIAGNKVRGVNGDGIQVQSDGNLILRNKVWRNYGHPIHICGNEDICLEPYTGLCAKHNVLQQNKLGWNQAGWILDNGCGTSLMCHSKQSVNISASCTPMILYVNQHSGWDDNCTNNDPTRKCRTINGAIANAEARYWIILEDDSYTEAVVIPHSGLVLRNNKLNFYVILQAPPRLSEPIITVNASDVSLEALYVQHTNPKTTQREIGIHITPLGSATNIEDCKLSRRSTSEPTQPGSRGLIVEAPQVTVLENLFNGFPEYQLLLTAPKAYIWMNVFVRASQVAIMIQQDPSPASTTGTVIRENIIMCPGLDGIQIQGDGTLIEFNEISNAQRVGIHLCTYSNESGLGGACNWTDLDTVEFPQDNMVKDNRAIRSPINYIDDLNISTLNNFTWQLPVYEPLGITDPVATLTSRWALVSPENAIVGGVVPIRVLGFWVRGYKLEVKLAAGSKDCYGFVPVGANGRSITKIDEEWNFGVIGPLSQSGEYRVCIKHRQDWEPTQNIVTVTPIDVLTSTAVYGGAPSCEAALQAIQPAACGCWFQRGAPDKYYFLSTDLPLSMMTSGISDIGINQGCCVRQTLVRTKNYSDPLTSWGLCSDMV